MLVARDGDDLVVADVAAMVRSGAGERLQRALAGNAPAARPLLIPHRFEWTLGDRAFHRMAEALDPLAVTVRMIAPGVGALQTLPKCLEPVPAPALGEQLSAPPDAIASTDTWVEHLLQATRLATLRDAAEALALLETVRALPDADPSRVWRRIEPAELAALIGAS